jgi:hypothetical protein
VAGAQAGLADEGLDDLAVGLVQMVHCPARHAHPAGLGAAVHGQLTADVAIHPEAEANHDPGEDRLLGVAISGFHRDVGARLEQLAVAQGNAVVRHVALGEHQPGPRHVVQGVMDLDRQDGQALLCDARAVNAQAHGTLGLELGEVSHGVARPSLWRRKGQGTARCEHRVGCRALT